VNGPRPGRVPALGLALERKAFVAVLGLDSRAGGQMARALIPRSPGGRRNGAPAPVAVFPLRQGRCAPAVRSHSPEWPDRPRRRPLGTSRSRSNLRLPPRTRAGDRRGRPPLNADGGLRWQSGRGTPRVGDRAWSQARSSRCTAH